MQPVETEMPNPTRTKKLLSAIGRFIKLYAGLLTSISCLTGFYGAYIDDWRYWVTILAIWAAYAWSYDLHKVLDRREN